MTRIAAAILAGGRGERLGGVNKALLEIGGRTLLSRVLEAVGDADPVLLCSGANQFHEELPIPHAHRLADLETPYAGPLAGVAAAIAFLSGRSADLLLTVAVDTAFFPHDFIARSRAAMGDRDAVIGAYDGQSYPTNALWRAGALASLPGDLRAGTAPHSLKRLAEGLRTVSLDYAALSPENPFANANTEADLAALRARTRSPPA